MYNYNIIIKIKQCDINVAIREKAIMALYSKDFGKAFSNLIDKYGVTCYQISQYSHLDQGYLSRLRNGEKHDPSPETLVKISLSLAHFSSEVKLYDIEALFNAAGHSLQIKV